MQSNGLPEGWENLSQTQELGALMVRVGSVDSKVDNANSQLEVITDNLLQHSEEIEQLKSENSLLRKEVDELKRRISSPMSAELRISEIPLKVTESEIDIARAVLMHISLSRYADSILTTRKIK